MSLVLEALRRVEKAAARPGSVGVAVSSYRPAQRRKTLGAPLILGLVTGALLLLFWRAEPPAGRLEAGSDLSAPAANRPAAGLTGPANAASPEAPASLAPVSRREGEVALPEAEEPAPVASNAAPRRAPKPSLTPDPPPPRQALVLQAISERDSRPIAVINDQLVREGDVLEGVRILSIGAESVEVLRGSGTSDTLRFAPPPTPLPLPSPADETPPASF